MRGVDVGTTGSRSDQQCATLSNTLGYIGARAHLEDITDIYPHCQARAGTTLRNILQRSDSRQRKDHFAQHALTIGYTSRVTLCLSNRSSVIHRESGVTMRRGLSSRLTLLRSWEARRLSTHRYSQVRAQDSLHPALHDALYRTDST